MVINHRGRKRKDSYAGIGGRDIKGTEDGVGSQERKRKPVSCKFSEVEGCRSCKRPNSTKNIERGNRNVALVWLYVTMLGLRIKIKDKKG